MVCLVYQEEHSVSEIEAIVSPGEEMDGYLLAWAVLNWQRPETE